MPANSPAAWNQVAGLRGGAISTEMNFRCFLAWFWTKGRARARTGGILTILIIDFLGFFVGFGGNKI